MIHSFFLEKSFLVTGASSGIGRALVLELNRNGTVVGAIARRKELLKELKNEAKFPDKIISFPGDVSDFSQLKKITEEFRKKVRRIDGMIHSAGISMRGLAKETDIKVYENLMNVNFYPLVHLFKLLESELRQNQGHFIAVSSLQGRFATQYRSGYAASKHAVQAFMDSIRLETCESGMHVMTVSPGYVKTDISLKALSGDGSAYGIMDEGIKNGLAAEKVATIILKAIESKKRDVYPSQFREMLAYWISRFSLSLLDRLLRNARVT
ncbi:SDR family NAD(P)-dependent oxidoreductase [Leptospira kirschneri]|uniref:SDR family NAD(P)-dependent oxidoreductase n=1 Tax=Leptospira kirschneri TaxID=29507 RepID=UPI0002980E1C|nr:SDR family NAD(P)-dependent oxidoreductase [Leptospira kirschneri]EKQ84852.1 KR domain protein [Leptospira kirschneri serovar Grippotyphosa str. Moskva]EKR08537.1 KR domain protein [Leptospira kirschneri serovar Valbuzzi str. 200702274]OOV48116.1 SDR family oxidoreductase [Leptospira kirschneri serovar Grippotyphosa]UZW35909.1 SDR family NAD(P)-dependent oxidoreductase [Leptospira kirschneri]WHO99608.1 SDR family NAD(P)-dependent oxidoreductase [Leptospira kirschneri]